MNRTCIVVVGLVVGLTGCVDKSAKTQAVQGRSQIGEDPNDLDFFGTTGQKTTVGNTDAIPVSGVGLVYGLAGTGSPAPPGGWRSMLENSLKKQGFSNIKELLDDPAKTTSLVMVTALIPPGARKGEAVDIRVYLPDESKTTSLKGGKLLACELVSSDTTGNIQSLAKGNGPSGPSGNLLIGTTWAKAEGAVVAGTFVTGKDDTRGKDAEGQPSYREGRVWGGGRITQVRPYYFLMNPGEQTIRTAANVAERLNATFHATAEPNRKVAEAKTRELVLVNVPSAYRHNHYRFLVVSRHVPLMPAGPDSGYRRKLEEELLEPSTALTAAIKLEALGGDSHRALRVGLESPSPWVRYAAAESLAYLGQTDGTAELAKLADEHPALRAHCLKALASIDDASSTDRLGDLMASADPTLRYGAFVALRLADENNAAIRGQQLNGFWLHRVAAGSPGMVHLSSDRRSEVVLFGDGLSLRGPVPPLPIGNDFTVSLPAGQDLVKVTRIVRVNGDATVKELKCPPDLASVLGTLAKLGGSYTEAVEFLTKADRAQVLSTAVVTDALPREMTVVQLAMFSKVDPTLGKVNVEVARVGTVKRDLDATGFDLPNPDAEAKTEPAPARLPRNQDPGRIFGPKRPAEPVGEPIIPAGGSN
ncbi:MAG TPA: flagellar basal body P-ring protein FlgI [Gemmataceae bacterium]|nr:flagellar basal body P-ring protein FlgI [Gemmataceae bacterium]